MTNRTIARIFSVVCLPQLPLAVYGLLMLLALATEDSEAFLYFFWTLFGLYLTMEYTVQGWGQMNETMAKPLFVWWASFLYNAAIAIFLVVALFTDGMPRYEILPVIIFFWTLIASAMSWKAIRNIRGCSVTKLPPGSVVVEMFEPEEYIRIIVTGDTAGTNANSKISVDEWQKSHKEWIRSLPPEY